MSVFFSRGQVCVPFGAAQTLSSKQGEGGEVNNSQVESEEIGLIVRGLCRGQGVPKARIHAYTHRQQHMCVAHSVAFFSAGPGRAPLAEIDVILGPWYRTGGREKRKKSEENCSQRAYVWMRQQHGLAKHREPS